MFHHAFAWLKIRIEANAGITLKEAVVSSDEGIANAVTLNAVSGEISAVPSSAAETVTLTLNEGQGIRMNQGDTLLAYVVIPACQYTNLHIVCGNFDKIISGTMQCESGHLYPVNLMTKLSKPVAEPGESRLVRGDRITLSSKEGGTIFYTTDGSTPTEDSKLYPDEGIVIEDACTVKAIAVKDGWYNSDVMSVKYKIQTAPEPDITFDDNGVLTISSSVEDAVIYYCLGDDTRTPFVEYDPSDKPQVEQNTIVQARVESPRYDGGYVAWGCFKPVVTLGRDEFLLFEKSGRVDVLVGTFEGYGILFDGKKPYYYLRSEREDIDCIICSVQPIFNTAIRWIEVETEIDQKLAVVAENHQLRQADVRMLDTYTVLVTRYTGKGISSARYEFPSDTNFKGVAIRAFEESCGIIKLTIGFD